MDAVMQISYAEGVCVYAYVYLFEVIFCSARNNIGMLWVVRAVFIVRNPILT